MSNKLKDKLRNIGKSEQLSTLELWQSHIKGLGRASLSSPADNTEPSFLGDISEQSISIDQHFKP